MISHYLNVNIIALVLGVVLVFSGVTMLSSEGQADSLDVNKTSIEEPYFPANEDYANQDDMISTYQASQKEVVRN